MQLNRPSPVPNPAFDPAQVALDPANAVTPMPANQLPATPASRPLASMVRNAAQSSALNMPVHTTQRTGQTSVATASGRKRPLSGAPSGQAPKQPKTPLAWDKYDKYGLKGEDTRQMSLDVIDRALHKGEASHLTAEDWKVLNNLYRGTVDKNVPKGPLTAAQLDTLADALSERKTNGQYVVGGAQIDRFANLGSEKISRNHRISEKQVWELITAHVRDKAAGKPVLSDADMAKVLGTIAGADGTQFADRLKTIQPGDRDALEALKRDVANTPHNLRFGKSPENSGIGEKFDPNLHNDANPAAGHRRSNAPTPVTDEPLTPRSDADKSVIDRLIELYPQLAPVLAPMIKPAPYASSQGSGIAPSGLPARRVPTLSPPPVTDPLSTRPGTSSRGIGTPTTPGATPDPAANDTRSRGLDNGFDVQIPESDLRPDGGGIRSPWAQPSPWAGRDPEVRGDANPPAAPPWSDPANDRGNDPTSQRPGHDSPGSVDAPSGDRGAHSGGRGKGRGDTYQNQTFTGPGSHESEASTDGSTYEDEQRTRWGGADVTNTFIGGGAHNEYAGASAGRDDRDGYSASAEAHANAMAGFTNTTEFTTDDGYAFVTTQAGLSSEQRAGARASANHWGPHAEAAGSTEVDFVTASVGGGGATDNNEVAGQASLEATATGYMNGAVGGNPGGGHVQGEAFIGGQVTASGEVSVGDGTATVSGSASAEVGVGIGGGVSAGMEDGHLQIGGSINVALGIGLKLEFNIDIDLEKIADFFKDLFGGDKPSPYQTFTDEFNKANNGKTNWSAAQLEFYMRAYTGGQDLKTVDFKAVLNQMRNDGVLSQDAEGHMQLGGMPSTDDGKGRVADMILRTGASNDSATSINADQMAHALNWGNIGDSERTSKMQTLIALYGGNGQIDKAGLMRMMNDGTLSWGDIRTVHNGETITGTGYRAELNANKVNHADLARALAANGLLNGAQLAERINAASWEYFGNKDVYVGNDQAQFAINGYSDNGQVGAAEIQRMLDDGVITTNDRGNIDLNVGAIFGNLQNNPHMQDIAFRAITRSGGRWVTDGGRDGKSLEWIIDREGLAKALNMANRGDSVNAGTLDRLFGELTQNNKHDHSNLRDVNLIFGLANGSFNWGAIQTDFQGKRETATGIQPRLANGEVLGV